MSYLADFFRMQKDVKCTCSSDCDNERDAAEREIRRLQKLERDHLNVLRACFGPPVAYRVHADDTVDVTITLDAWHDVCELLGSEATR